MLPMGGVASTSKTASERPALWTSVSGRGTSAPRPAKAGKFTASNKINRRGNMSAVYAAAASVEASNPLSPQLDTALSAESAVLVDPARRPRQRLSPKGQPSTAKLATKEHKEMKDHSVSLYSLLFCGNAGSLKSLRLRPQNAGNQIGQILGVETCLETFGHERAP